MRDAKRKRDNAEVEAKRKRDRSTGFLYQCPA